MNYMLHGACTKCGCAVHECECPERDHADPTFVEKLDTYLSRPGAPKGCFDCLGHASLFMVHDAIWDAAWPFAKQQRRVMQKMAAERGLTKQIRQHLCLTCLETRLKRKLTLDDFTLAPVNDGIRLGYRMGSEPPTGG